MNTKLKRKLSRLLEKYDIWRDYKFGWQTRERRDEMFRDFIELYHAINKQNENNQITS